MRKRHFAAIAAVGLLLGSGGIAATQAVHAATPSCGGMCIEFYTAKFGSGFVSDVYKQSKSTGTPVILFQKGNNDPAEDFTYAFQGTVDDLFKAGLVSSAVDLHYGGDEAFEFEYKPLGSGTSQCIGITAPHPANGTKVALEPCGVNGGTVWILDGADIVHHGVRVYYPFINGADTNFSDPYVLNYPSGNPTDKPRVQFSTWQLGLYSDGTPWDNQLVGVRTGVES